MKSVLAAAIAAVAALPAAASAASHPFDVHDLVMMNRASDPVLSPDGRSIAYGLRETDYDANKGKNSLWTVPYGGGCSPSGYGVATMRPVARTSHSILPSW